MNHRLALILVSALATGCASTAKYEVSEQWDKATLASVTIYRTSTFFHSANLERPFFYIDDLEAGKLGTGMAVSTKVTAGKHIITVRESFLFMPGSESGRIEYEFEAGKTYYFRYSHEFSGLSAVGGTAVATGSTSFSLADERAFLERR